MDFSDSTISSPIPSPSESESRFYHSNRQFMFQPRIDNTFKQIKSFGGNIYVYVNQIKYLELDIFSVK